MKSEKRGLMVSIVIAIHVVVCFVLVITVLLQQGKGADIGAVFGGSSQTVFGSGGAGNFLTKLTGGLAVVFFATAIFLAYSSTRRVTGSLLEHTAGHRTTAPSRMPMPHAPVAPAAPKPAPAPNK
ncbi:MAG: preprotein translocase subunit SecG [Candidatus Binataceae bacterium]